MVMEQNKSQTFVKPNHRRLSMDRIGEIILPNHNPSIDAPLDALNENVGLEIMHKKPMFREMCRRRFSMERISTVEIPKEETMCSMNLTSKSFVGRMLSDSHPKPRNTSQRRSSLPPNTIIQSSFPLSEIEKTKNKIKMGRRQTIMHTGAPSFPLSVIKNTKHEIKVGRRQTMMHTEAPFVTKFSRRFSLESVATTWNQTSGTYQQVVLSGIENIRKEEGENIIGGIGDTKSTEGTNPQYDTSFPNKPHPALEYPPLYFLLKRFPLIMDSMTNFYKIRWEMQYPLQKRVPFSKKLRKIGLFMTWGELILLLPFFGIIISGMMTTFYEPSVTNSGHVSRLPLAMCFLTANHNSLLTLLLGIPFERAIKYHKLSGYLAFLNGIGHTYVAYAGVSVEGAISGDSELLEAQRFIHWSMDGQTNLSGTCLITIILLMLITSLPKVRSTMFELFYYFHIVFAILMTTCAFYHSGIFVVILASILWGGDLFVRKVLMTLRYPREASIRNLTDSVVEVRILKKDFDYNPGQYVFISVPEISLFQWHPISISSSPHQHEVTLHIRKRGSWTKALHHLATAKKRISILLEGPYGSLSVDLTSQRYKMIMLVSGGIGVTPMQSIAHQLMHEQEMGLRDLNELRFLWTARDPQVMEKMNINERSSINNHTNEIQSDSMADSTQVCGTIASDLKSHCIAEKLLSDLPIGYSTDKELENEMPLDAFEEDDQKVENDCVRHFPDDDVWFDDVEDGIYKSNIIESPKYDRQDKWEDSDAMRSTTGITTMHSSGNKEKEDILKLEFYLTSKEMNDHDITNYPFVNQGRPDMKEVFHAMRKEAKAKGESRVAVCVCAPLRLVEICKKSCVKCSNHEVKFDFHSEVFD